LICDIGAYEKDLTPPEVDSTTPANRATGVRRGANLTVTFSEKMEPNTIVMTPRDSADPTVGTSSSVKLERYDKKKRKYQPVRGVETSCNTSCDTVTLDPATSLLANTKYKATITTAVKDKAGNALAKTFSWTFTTGRS
jgi:hypothetical protein